VVENEILLALTMRDLQILFQMGMPSMVEFSERLKGTRCASAAEAATGT